MAIKRMPVRDFVNGLIAAYNRHDGYIMGAKGQNPKKWAKNSWWFTQYTSSKQRNQALEWREKCARVWDCNGLAEGLYEDFSGVNINTKARYNYAQWCGTKGTGRIPVKNRVPGAAVFIHSSSAGYITHVGYLIEPVKKNHPEGDWYVIEARGVMYGVVRTKLYDRGWNRWGLMTKYFDYSDNSSQSVDSNVESLLGSRLLRNGSEGEDVKELQTNLIRLGYDCGKWGADGDYGDVTEIAVRSFQKDHELFADGIYGPKTHKAMSEALAAMDAVPEEPRRVTVVGGNCWVRTAPNTEGTKLGVAHAGETYSFGGQTSDDGWLLITFANQNGWISGKYGRLI